MPINNKTFNLITSLVVTTGIIFFLLGFFFLIDKNNPYLGLIFLCLSLNLIIALNKDGKNKNIFNFNLKTNKYLFDSLWCSITALVVTPIYYLVEEDFVTHALLVIEINIYGISDFLVFGEHIDQLVISIFKSNVQILDYLPLIIYISLVLFSILIHYPIYKNLTNKV